MGATSGIVVGYDGSPSSELALTWAIAEAGETGQPLTLVQSIEVDPIVYGMGVGGGEVLYAGGDPDIEPDGLLRAREALGTDAVHLRRPSGSAARHLVHASEESSLVVTGTRGHGHLTSVILGSTAYAVASHADCPVVVVRVASPDTDAPARPGPDRPVVVGIDDVAASSGALDAAASVAARTGAPLRIIRAVEYHAFLPALASGGASVADYDEALRRDSRAVVDAAAERVRATHPDLVIESEAVDGAPAWVLGRESRKAGLIVVGSRGRGGFAGLLLGSNSHAVLHEAVCPVMVVRGE